MAPGLLSHRLHTQQKVIETTIEDHYLHTIEKYCEIETFQIATIFRGFDTFFGEYAQQADHYTRQYLHKMHHNRHFRNYHRNNLKIGMGWEMIGCFSQFNGPLMTMSIMILVENCNDHLKRGRDLPTHLLCSENEKDNDRRNTSQKKEKIMEIVAIIILREHEINSHIGSGYDLWREDNVTREWEGIYRCCLQ